MSRNEWESGTIVIPSDQYVAFRKALIAEHNRIQEGYLARAEVVLWIQAYFAKMLDL